MKIFVSWSGTSSHEAAILIREWLRRVLQYSDPFVSSKDISKGAQWLVTISDELGDTAEGIVCVTPSNAEAPWLNYEAGALAKTTGQTAVRTVLLGLAPGDIPAGAPLSNFQHTKGLDEAEMWSLIESIHQRTGDADAASFERIRWAFDQAWPDLRDKLAAIDLSAVAPQDPLPKDESLIRDVLEEVKQISIAVAALNKSRTAETEAPVVSEWDIPRLTDKEIDSVGPGTVLEHKHFGIGLVRSIEIQKGQRVAVVRFRMIEKRILLRYAPVVITPNAG